jgi:hypothetical protein
MYMQRNNETVRVTIVAVVKQSALHIVNVCVATVIQHAMRLRRIVVCELSSSIILIKIYKCSSNTAKVL